MELSADTPRRLWTATRNLTVPLPIRCGTWLSSNSNAVSGGRLGVRDAMIRFSMAVGSTLPMRAGAGSLRLCTLIASYEVNGVGLPPPLTDAPTSCGLHLRWPDMVDSHHCLLPSLALPKSVP